MADPWDAYPVVPQGGQGDTVIARDPYKVEDQQFQRDAAARADRDQQLQEQRFQITQGREAQRDARAAEKDKEGSESERTAGFLTGRIVDAVGRMGGAITKDRSAQAPTFGVETVRKIAGESAANYLTDSERQQARAAELDILDAALTLGTGAAYNREQLEGYRTSYFPQLGDDEATVTSKRSALRSLLENARTKAGKSAPDIDKALSVLDSLNKPAVDPGVPDDGSTAEERAAGLTGSVTDDTPTPPDGGPGGGNYSLENVANGIGQGVGSIVEGVASIPAMVVDPIATSLGRALGYDNYTSDFANQVRGDLGLPDNPNASDTITKFATSALTGSLAAKGAATLANPGVFRSALGAMGASPGRDLAAGTASGVGAVAGKASGLPGGEIIGALGGGLAGYSAAGRMGMTRQPNALMSAADDLGVSMMPADVGGVGTRMATGAVGSTLGGVPIAQGAERSIASASAAKGRIALDIGEITDNVGAGAAAKRGFEEFTRSSEKRAGELYEKVSVPSDAKVQLANTRQGLAEVTRGLESNPELSRLWANHPRLRATLEALTPSDTRQAGLVRLTAASDRLKAAEDSVTQASKLAERNLTFERSQARDAADAARSQYDDLVSEARKEVDKAQSAYDAMRAQNVGAGTLVDLRKGVEAAQAKYSAFSKRDTSLPDVRAAVQSLDESQAKFNAIRFQEPKSDELVQAQKALSEAKEQHDAAFVEARQLPQGGELSWQDMKRFRSIVGEVVGQPGIQRDGSDIAALRKLYGALSTDMEVTAAQAGPRALQEFRRANQYWRGREGRIDDVFSTLLGKKGNKSDEAVFKNINSWASDQGGDFSRIARTIRSMPADEANTIRATLVQRMGMATPANQNATNEVFSPAKFSTEWRGMSPRAKSVLFPDKQHRQDLEKLALITDGMKQADKFQNFSRTAIGVNGTAQGALALAHPVTAAALAGLQFGAGKLLASPKFARIIASTIKVAPQIGQQRLTQQLSQLAIKEPILANDIGAVLTALNDNAARVGAVAASPNERPQDERKP